MRIDSISNNRLFGGYCFKCPFSTVSREYNIRCPTCLQSCSPTLYTYSLTVHLLFAAVQWWKGVPCVRYGVSFLVELFRSISKVRSLMTRYSVTLEYNYFWREPYQGYQVEPVNNQYSSSVH